MHFRYYFALMKNKPQNRGIESPGFCLLVLFFCLVYIFSSLLHKMQLLTSNGSMGSYGLEFFPMYLRSELALSAISRMSRNESNFFPTDCLT